MLIRNTGDRYGLVSKALHWTLAVLMLGLVWLGWVLVGMGYYDRWYYTVETAHASFGMLVLALAAFKLVWMLYSPAPGPQPELRAWERGTSKLVHWLLLLSMFLIPVTGYLTSTSSGGTVAMFDWFEIPAVVPVSDALRDWVIDVHYYAAYAVLVLVILHAGAALKHQFIDRHGTLKRML
ncbi:MAG: cytochrome b [Gammaproteobacteria bacterium]|nr:cytochrome b [Gammaproteobacteria bacterium]